MTPERPAVPRASFSDYACENLFPRVVMSIELGVADGSDAVQGELDEVVDVAVLDEPTRHYKQRIMPGVSFGDAIDRLTAHYPRSSRRLTFKQWLRAVFTGRYQP